jgi:hypothetical protein
MTIEELNAIQAAMPTAELISKARAWNTKLCATGGNAWTLRIPVSENDPDMVFGEICRRLEIAANFDKSFALVNSAQNLLEELEETHAALCFTGDYVGSLRYEKNKAAIARAKGLKP